MRKKRFDKKFPIIISIAIMLSVIMFATIHSFLNIKKTQKMARNNLIEITNGVTETINAWLNEKKKQIHFFSIKNIVNDFLKHKKVNIKIIDFFSLVKTIDYDYENIFIANLNGEIIITSGKKSANITDLKKLTFWKNFAKKKYNLYIEKKIQKSPVTGKLSLIIITRVTDKNGDLLGFIGSSLDWEKFIKKFIVPNKFGQTGNVAITDEKGINIAHPDRRLLLKDLSYLPYIKKMLEERNGFQELVYKEHKKYIAFKSLEELGWIVNASVNETELIEHSVYIRNILLIIAVIFLILTIFIIGYIDIFKLKKAESKLEDSIRKFNLIFNRGNDGIFVHMLEKGKSRNFFEVNQVFCNLLNHKKEDILNLSPCEVFIFDQNIQYESIIKEIVEKKYSSFETKLYVGEKTSLFVELRIFLMETAGTKSVIGFMRDITTRIVFEKELKNSRDHLDKIVHERTKKLWETNTQLEHEIKEKDIMEKALRESEEKYRDLVERANDGIIVIQNERIKFSNKKISEMLNYSRDEMYDFHVTHILAPDYRDEILNRYKKRIKGEKITQIYETKLLTKDAKIINVEVNAGIINFEGKPADFVFVRDLTERKRIEQEKQKHYEQLVHTDKLVALGTLVSGVAHEINNPNNAIMLNTPVLLEAWRDALPILDEYKKSCGDFVIAGIPYSMFIKYIFDLIADIQKSSGKIKTIVEDLKSFVKPSKSELNEEVNINNVVRSSINLISHLVMKSTEYFQVEYGEKIPLIKGNFQRLEQVIVNLIQNSCQALPDRKKGIYISTEFIKGENQVEVKVADEGIGIKPEQMNRIMDPFFTTKRERGGTGLGLSVSMSLIKEHQGTLSFDSQVEKGTTATIRLPVKKKFWENEE